MATDPLLFEPLKIREVTLPNRIVLSPLCMYSANSGVASDWQFAHLCGGNGCRAARKNYTTLSRDMDG